MVRPRGVAEPAATGRLPSGQGPADLTPFQAPRTSGGCAVCTGEGEPVILLRRPAVLVPSALLLLTAACGGQGDRPTAAATSTTVAATTTTKPAATAAELAWVEGLTALRERLEERTRPQAGVALTQAKMREFIAASRSCTPSLGQAGDAIAPASAGPPHRPSGLPAVWAVG